MLVRGVRAACVCVCVCVCVFGCVCLFVCVTVRARATHWLSGRDLLMAGEAPRGGGCKELGWCLGGHDTATERPHGRLAPMAAAKQGS